MKAPMPSAAIGLSSSGILARSAEKSGTRFPLLSHHGSTTRFTRLRFASCSCSFSSCPCLCPHFPRCQNRQPSTCSSSCCCPPLRRPDDIACESPRDQLVV